MAAVVSSEIVPGNLKHPGRDLGFAAETGQAPPNTKKDLLSCIEGLFFGARQATSQSPDRPPKSFIDLVEYHVLSVPWIAIKESPFFKTEDRESCRTTQVATGSLSVRPATCDSQLTNVFVPVEYDALNDREFPVVLIGQEMADPALEFAGDSEIDLVILAVGIADGPRFELRA